MITQNLNSLQKQELLSFYNEKVAQIQFQVLKMRRTLAKREAQEQKWKKDLAMYQQRKQEGEAALQVLSESNLYYLKIRLDVQKCEIRILELEIRFQRHSQAQKNIQLAAISAKESTLVYYQQLISAMKQDSYPIMEVETDTMNQPWINTMYLLSALPVLFQKNQLGRGAMSSKVPILHLN